MIENMGFPVYYSDSRAKELVNESQFLKSKITQLLGEESYDKQGIYNRKFVSTIVFENPEKLQALNAIIHPAVKSDFQNWL